MYVIDQSMYEIEFLNDKNEDVMTDVHVSCNLTCLNDEKFRWYFVKYMKLWKDNDTIKRWFIFIYKTRLQKDFLKNDGKTAKRNEKTYS